MLALPIFQPQSAHQPLFEVQERRQIHSKIEYFVPYRYSKITFSVNRIVPSAQAQLPPRFRVSMTEYNIYIANQILKKFRSIFGQIPSPPIYNKTLRKKRIIQKYHIFHRYVSIYRKSSNKYCGSYSFLECFYSITGIFTYCC